MVLVTPGLSQLRNPEATRSARVLFGKALNCLSAKAVLVVLLTLLYSSQEFWPAFKNPKSSADYPCSLGPSAFRMLPHISTQIQGGGVLGKRRRGALCCLTH
ncbi:hypothetical protein SRHO_G00156260 [Serrasalmus rhombeus]